MGTDINFNKSLGRTYGTRIGLPAFDPAAQAYFAATGITGATQQTAIDNLVKGLKQDGIWSKMKAVYPFVTDNRNLLSFTEDYSNAFWFKSNVSVTTNTTIAPDGTTTADTVQNSGTSNAFLIQQNVARSAGTYTQSFYFKKNNNDWVAMYTSDNGSNYAIAWFNVNTGVVGTASAVGNFSAASSSILSVGNGWYRCSLTFTKPLTTLSDTSALVPNGNNSLTSVVGQNAFLWGTQIELGSTATTYQPMLSSQQAFISNQFKYNLVNPVDSDAAFRLVFNGGWTHSANGATPNGTNGYADTFLVPSSVLAQNNTHLSFYSRTNALNTLGFDIGSFNSLGGGVGSSCFAISYSTSPSGHFRNRISTATPSTGFIPTDARGLFVSNRTTSTQQKAYQNGILKETANVNSDGLCPFQIAISANRVSTVSVGDYSNRQAAFASIGDGLTDAEALALYNTVNNYQVALSRNV